jgi:hypothetical protein
MAMDAPVVGAVYAAAPDPAVASADDRRYRIAAVVKTVSSEPGVGV